MQKAGFQKAVRDALRLQIAERASLDLSLQVGEVSQSVNVTSDVSVVQTEGADRGLSIENNRVLNTPLQGRNVFANAWSAPGVTVTRSPDGCQSNSMALLIRGFASQDVTRTCRLPFAESGLPSTIEGTATNTVAEVGGYSGSGSTGCPGYTATASLSGTLLPG